MGRRGERDGGDLDLDDQMCQSSLLLSDEDCKTVTEMLQILHFCFWKQNNLISPGLTMIAHSMPTHKQEPWKAVD